MKAWEAIKKAIKPRNLIVIILLLVANSFAWFIYATEADTRMTAHVRAWKVIFEAGDNEVVDFVDIEVDTMYPGMDEFLYTITAYNRSDMKAKLDYKILTANFLGEEYITIEGKNEGKGDATNGTLTSDELVDMLENDFPFKISISLSAVEMVENTGEANYYIRVNWAFESGDDAADTYWGTKAAQYEEDYPDTPSINIELKITISQVL